MQQVLIGIVFVLATGCYWLYIENTTLKANNVALEGAIATQEEAISYLQNDFDLHTSQLQEMTVKGRNMSEGIPRSFTINSNEILEALQEPLKIITNAAKTALESTPPELSTDIAENGIVLTGGGALLTGLNKLIQEETGIPVIIADDPLTCVARGGGMVLDLIDKKGQDFFTLE